ncbi:MAG: ankyrin repeat domain-containing protein [Phycisphaerae bacterium]
MPAATRGPDSAATPQAPEPKLLKPATPAEVNALDALAAALDDGRDPNEARKPAAGSPLESEGRFTRLHVAAAEGYAAVCDRLIAAGADVDARSDPDRLTPLYYATAAGHARAAELLLRRGADPDAAGAMGDTPLHAAAGEGHRAIVSLLLQAGADVNAVDAYGGGPIADALWGGRRKTALLLLKQTGLDALKTVRAPAALGMDVYCHIQQAIKEDEEAMALAMIRRCRDVNGTAGPHGNTLVHWAAGQKRLRVLRALAAQGADLDRRNEEGFAPLHMVAFHEDGTDVARTLLQQGAKADPNTPGGVRPLLLASRYRKTDMVEALLQYGADVNQASRKGNTPLLLATMFGRTETMKILLAAGAKTDVQSQEGDTPILEAVDEGADVLNVLLRAGANANFANRQGETALHHAAGAREVASVRLLIGNGADVNVSDSSGAGPLHWAAEAGVVQAAELLLEAGAKVNATDNQGRTPLHQAAEWGQADMVQLLLRRKADVNAKSRKGKTPLDLAINEAVVRALRKAGAKGNPPEIPLVDESTEQSGPPRGMFFGHGGNYFYVAYAPFLPADPNEAQWIREELIRAISRLRPANLSCLLVPGQEDANKPTLVRSERSAVREMAARVKGMKPSADAPEFLPVWKKAVELPGTAPKPGATYLYVLTDGKFTDRTKLLDAWEQYDRSVPDKLKTCRIRPNLFLYGRRSPAVWKILRELAHRGGGVTVDMQARMEEELRDM